MNFYNSEQNIAAWNNQPLDNLHDIIVSFDYARYNNQGFPTGGFAVVFFDSIVDMPRGGGPGYSLGYTPSSQTDYCKLLGYPGLQSAYLAVGFDRYGFFAAQTDRVDGIVTDFVPNSFTIRGGVDQNYGLVYNSSNISNLNEQLTAFNIDDFVATNTDIQFKSVRIVLIHGSTQLKIQLKSNANNDDYVDAATINLPFKVKTAVKVAITNTALEPNTQMVLKNFNVAGYPGETGTKSLSGCMQQITLKDNSIGTILPMGREFIATNTDKDLLTYGTDTQKYVLKNTVYFGADYNIIGAKNNYILTRALNSASLGIYKYLGEKTTRLSTVNLPGGSYPYTADIDTDNTLVVCTTAVSGSVYFYKLIENTTDLTQLGTWQIYQTINPTNTPTVSAYTPVSCSIYENNLLVSTTDTLVYAFQKNDEGAWTHIQTIESPLTGVTLFGKKVAVYGRDAVIAAPYAYKADYRTLGQGEVYHYFLYSNTNQWRKVMDIGNFYKINTPAGNFGTSIGLHENTLVVGSPGENFVSTPDVPYEDMYNVGKAYVFNKTAAGLFSQAIILFPEDNVKENRMFFGYAVNAYNNYVAVLAPFVDENTASKVFVYDTDCRYVLPPQHFPVPDCALGLVDSRGYVITLSNDNTYMLSVSCELIAEGVLP